MNYKQWLVYATKKLCHSKSAKCDANTLLQYVTGKDITYIIAFGESKLTIKQQQLLALLLDRRCYGEPIAYLIEEKEFWSLPLKISPVTFIPRPDTECLIEQAILIIDHTYDNNQSINILDLGTGTGAIALALAVEYPTAKITGVDISNTAIKIAKYNANKLAINNVNFCQSDWFTILLPPIQQFNIIVSNPPYIDQHDLYLHKGDIRFEPKAALIAANHGLADIKLIIEQSCYYLLDKGWLLLEHGWLQARQVRKLFYDCNYLNVVTFQDYGGNDRITIGQFKNYK